MADSDVALFAPDLFGSPGAGSTWANCGSAEPLTPESWARAIALYEEHRAWLDANPLGTEKNPYVLSPSEYEDWKRLGLAK